MAFQTGNAKNMAELIPQMISLLKTQGWILDKQEGDLNTSGYITWYIHHPDAGYFNLRSWGGKDLRLRGTTGFDGSQSFYQQPGATEEYAVYLGDSNRNMTTYDFFITARYCHVVIQDSDSHFYHFGFGLLNKEGDYTGGQYLYMGSASSIFPFDHHYKYPQGSYVRAELPGETGITSGWYAFYQNSPRAIGLGAPMMGAPHPDILAVESSQSVLGGVLAPVPNAIYVTTSQGACIRLGVVPDFCVCQMQGLTPRAKVAVNGEQWMVVPINRLTFKKPSSWDKEDTFTYAYAFRICV
ncbi:TPA: hypothetical protein I8Y21_004409 [Klebsiella oxytoca]|uniref:Uncharacterized protein n=1 Tax=Klebsiella oxytoca TaxID=571 RepID=A0AAN5LC24_KLEOX|nr:hypothetical protein [Klebsiella oxytoca]